MVEHDCNHSLASWPAAVVLEAIAREAAVLECPAPHERRSVLRSEAGLLVDRLLTTVARGRGALDVAIGERLAALAEGDRALRLGYSGVGDYARERLGIAPRSAQDMARLARELRARPLLRDAIRRGDVSTRKAQTVLAVARGAEEGAWVARARVETVRALEAAVRAATSGDGSDHEEAWARTCLPLSDSARAALDEAMDLAGRVLGATAPRWQRLEAICQEFLEAHPVEDPVDAAGDDLPWEGTSGERLDALKAALEGELGGWSFLAQVPPIEAPIEAPLPIGDAGAPGPCRLDDELQRLAAMRDRWDEHVGRLALLMQALGLWRDAGFVSFSHYCSERLGMSARAVEQRAWLERRLVALPTLRAAMREGRLTYEKARLVAGCADRASLDAWIARAEKATCIELRRQVEAAEHTQMCARGEVDLRLPKRVAGLVAAAFRAARRAAGRWLSPADCLERVARHFVETWRTLRDEASTPQRRALARDRGHCQVPGCSRAAVHAHHVVYRSRGGSDAIENLVSLCAAHHLHGVHRGFVRVQGRAPDGLSWELVLRDRGRVQR